MSVTNNRQSLSAIPPKLPCSSQAASGAIIGQTGKTSSAAARLGNQGITLASHIAPKEIRNNFLDSSIKFHADAANLGKFQAEFRALHNAFQNPAVPNQILLEQLRKIAPQEFLSELKNNLIMIYKSGESSPSVYAIASSHFLDFLADRFNSSGAIRSGSVGKRWLHGTISARAHVGVIGIDPSCMYAHQHLAT